ATSGWQRLESRDRGPWGGVVFGLILILVGAIALLAQLDIPTPPWRVILAAALVLVGLAMVVAARRGLNGGLLGLAILLTAVLVSRAALPIGGVDSGFGDRRVAVEAPDRLERDYGHAFGSMRIDLADASLPAGTTRLEASIAFGDLRITVPPGVGLRVTASTAFGSTRVLEDELGAFGQREFVTPGYDQAAKRLELRVSTAFGSTRINRGEP
ncbi:MAG: LiaF-related protein, partial [Chloroflexi bacterium]|nr:LiaF-related protein [Chloroflexota bacterium]